MTNAADKKSFPYEAEAGVGGGREYLEIPPAEGKETENCNQILLGVPKPKHSNSYLKRSNKSLIFISSRASKGYYTVRIEPVLIYKVAPYRVCRYK